MISEARKEYLKKYQKEYYKKNKKAIDEKNKLWAINNVEKHREHVRLSKKLKSIREHEANEI